MASIVDRAAVVAAAVNGRSGWTPDRDVVPVQSLEVVAVAGPLSTLGPVLFFYFALGVRHCFMR